MTGALVACSLGSSPSQASPLYCQLLPQLFEVYFKDHYSVKSLTDEVKAHTVEQFIRALDPSKSMLLQADIDRLQKDLPKMFATMATGDCKALTDTADLMIARSKTDEEFVKSFVDNPSYKIDESVELTLDPDKRGYPKTAEEKDATLKKMVHFQMSNYLLADLKLPEAKKQMVHRYELVVKRLTEKKPEDWVVNFAEAFATALDPHSSFLSQDNLEDFQIHMQLSLEGIGASLSSDDGFTVIEETIPGGGAEKSHKLRPKDKIISVAQEGGKPVSVIDMDLRDVVKLIRGKKGTKVTLHILRQSDKAQTFEVTIVRDKIDIKDQAAKLTYQTRKLGDRTEKIAVIDLPSFYGGEKGGRDCYTDVKDLLAKAHKEKVDGLVLNLSTNGGGLLEDAVRISGLFIRKGGIVATQSADHKVQVLADEDDDVQYAGPLVVLISRLSASASEILAGALKDYRRALIVGGDHTFGKGSVQVLQGLPFNLGGMKVTTGMFFIPSGFSTQQRGVEADIQVPSLFNTDDLGEKTLKYSLAPNKVASFVSDEANATPEIWKPVTPALVARLAPKSKERVAKDPKFADMLKEIRERDQNKGIIKLSDLRKKADEDKKLDKAAKTKKEREQKAKDADAPIINEGVNIVADWAAGDTAPAPLAHEPE